MNPPTPPQAFLPFTRRRFLGLWGSGLAGMAFERAGAAPAAAAREGMSGLRYNDPLQPLIFQVTRAWDLLNLELELVNFIPVRQRGFTGTGADRNTAGSNPNANPYNELKDGFGFHIASYAAPGYVILRLGGQHLAEQSLWDRPVLPLEGESEADVTRRKQATFILDRGENDLNNDLKFLRTGRSKGGGLAGAWLAGHSQIVFEIPQRFAPLPFDFDSIMEIALRDGLLRVHPRLLEAKPPEHPFFGSGDDEQLRMDAPFMGRHDTGAPFTRLEFPSMLYISPYDNAQWKLRPKAWGQRSELWSLDLDRPDRKQDSAGRPRELRRQGHLFAFDTEAAPARWPQEKNPEESPTTKYAKKETPKTSLYTQTRRLLVKQMTDDNGDILAEDFRVTTLGATAHLEYRPVIMPRLLRPTREKTLLDGGGASVGDRGQDGVIKSDDEKDPGFLAEWIQKTEIGRDYYVKESFAGWWFPFQLAAESVTISERLFCSGLTPDDSNVADVEGTLTAMLVARKFGLVKERVREFGLTESDDFDEVGAALARAMGLRKIEVMVDRTPTLSNQPTKVNGESEADRIRRGEDAVFAAGGNGEEAGNEIFWPRVAAPPADPKQKDGRQLIPYRFPVRLTFLDGRQVETHLPMLFCYSLPKGAELYSIAPAILRSLGINSKIPLVPPQAAAGFNAPDLSAKDGQSLLPLVSEGIIIPELHQALGHEPSDGDNKAGAGPVPARNSLRNVALCKALTAAFGGIREGLYEHAAEYRNAADRWLEESRGFIEPNALPLDHTRLMTVWVIDLVNRQKVPSTRPPVPAKVAADFFGCKNADDMADLAEIVVRTVAWGPDAYLGVDAGRGAKRLCAAMDWILGAHLKDNSKRVDALRFFISHIQKLPEFRIPCADASRLTQAVAPFAGWKAELELEPELRKGLNRKLSLLQIAWASQLGNVWCRMDFDDWFAKLFEGIHSKLFDGDVNQPRAPWHAALLSLIQKRHLHHLMAGTRPADLPACPWSVQGLAGEPEKKAFFTRAFAPMAAIAPATGPAAGRRHCVPADVHSAMTAARERLVNSIAAASSFSIRDGQDALRRVWDALEHALPGEIQLRQRIQQLSEDLVALKERGRASADRFSRELEKVLEDAALHLAHVAVHADHGMMRVEEFFEKGLKNVETTMAELHAVAENVKEWKSANLRKPAGLKSIHATFDLFIHDDWRGELRKLADAGNNDEIGRLLNITGEEDINETAKALRNIQEEASEEGKRLLALRARTFAAIDSSAESLKYFLQTDPQQALQHFKNVLHETGTRVVAEAEEKLLPVVELAAGIVARIGEAGSQATRYWEMVEGTLERKFGSVRNHLAKARSARLEILAEVRKLTGPLRPMLQELMGANAGAFIKVARNLEAKSEEVARAAGAKEDEAKKAIKEWRARLTARFDEDTAWVSERLAARILELLALARPVEEAIARPGENGTKVISDILKAEADLEKEIAETWTAGKAAVDQALEILNQQSPRFKTAVQEEIQQLTEAVKDAIKKAPAVRQDSLELFLICASSYGRAGLSQILRSLMAKAGAAQLNGYANEAEKQLEDAWLSIQSKLDRVQKKFGQNVSEFGRAFGNKLTAAGDGFSKDLKDCWKAYAEIKDQLAKTLQKRLEVLDGPALQLARKAELALQAPSLLKTFRDQTAKSIFHVDEMVIGMSTGGPEATKWLGEKVEDLRKSIGFPKLDAIKLQIPDLDGRQVVEITDGYIREGTRAFRSQVEGVEREAAGTFAKFKKDARSLVQESGLADSAAKLEKLSRDFGSIAREAENQLRRVERIANDVRSRIDGAGAELQSQINTIKDEAKQKIDAAVGDLMKEAKDFLPADMGKLFGVLPMKDILNVIGSPDKAPQMLANRLPDRLDRSYIWQTELKEFNLGGLLGFVPEQNPTGEPPALRITNKATFWVPKPGQPPRQPEFLTSGQMGAFSLALAGMMKLYFRGLTFTGRNGRFDINPKLGRAKDSGGSSSGSQSFMSFMGPLEAVDTLREKLAGFINGKNGPIVTVEEDRIFAGYAFQVPAITCGAMTIEHIRLSAEISLPLKSGALTFRFQLSEREVPFRVAVMCFTGGGFLGVQVSPDRRLCSVEGSAEFGGSLSLNLGIASGELFLMAGLYFKMEHAGVTFSGYVRAGGVITVLGFIEISILFYLALTYRSWRVGGQKKTEFRGECTVAVRVQVFCFKKTVRLHMEKTFEGDDSKSDSAEEIAFNRTPPLRLRRNGPDSLHPHDSGFWSEVMIGATAKDGGDGKDAKKEGDPTPTSLSNPNGRPASGYFAQEFAAAPNTQPHHHWRAYLDSFAD